MEFLDFYKKIPTYDNGEWTETEFTSLDDFRAFVKSTFKEPGKYELDETSQLFNEQARLFREQGDVYTLTAFRSKDFIRYWETEKQKSTQGVIFKNNNKTWYLPRDYYFWINFLPIYDKIKKKFDFPQVWDVQLHIALYEELAELHWKHSSILKKRQIASSYFHMGKFINRIWFDEGAILKIGASLKDYINLNGSWKFLDEYKTFLNSSTAWYRPMNPGKVLTWQQKIEVTQNGRKREVGLKGMMQGMSFEQSATKGVGGPCTLFFYEEAGIAPTMDQTFEYLRPAMQSGDITTGMFIAAGSVGDLKDCEPLKNFTLYPDENGIYAVETNLMDDTGLEGRSALFIPEQWGMPPYIDNNGNSMVKEALEALDLKFAQWKKELRPELYQLRISQHPRNIKEALAFREESVFPLNLVEDQKRQIEEKYYPYELIDLDEKADGSISVKKTNKPPISTFPIKLNEEDKTGSIVVWERPDKDPAFGQYIASIDPVSEGKTTTSESLCSIYVYKTATQVQRTNEQGDVENFIEGDKIVAAWCGRFDDINETHKRLRLIIEWYNAWTLVENNISLFIMYMIKERKQSYLIPKNQMLFLKEAQANKTVYQEYGWRNTGTLFKAHLLSYLIEWLKEVVDEDIEDDGTITKKHYGIRRVPDRMALVEMEAYRPGVNVDRLVSLAALISFVKIRESNTTRPIRVENDVDNNLQMSENLYKLNRGAFRNLGKSKSSKLSSKRGRSPFKHIGRK
jgi:hypothetical protein